MSFSQLTALVIGQGSIGQRHARILGEENAAVKTVSQHAENSFRNIEEAFSAADYDYVVIANETSQHARTIDSLLKLGFRGKLLVEKPLSSNPREVPDPLPFEKVGVAYNLRFHPVVQALRETVRGKAPVEIRIHVGQHLPEWRPGANYREGSSAKRSSGGGVLRDLSHELDLLGYLFGGWVRLVAIGGNRGVLDIETDELWSVLLELETGATVSLTLNYLDRPAERRITVNTRDDTISADVVAGSLSLNRTPTHFKTERDQTYRDQHRAMLDREDTTVCTLKDAADVMLTIAAIERSAQEGQWVYR